ncbi:MAG: helix-turn-helix domain-containing protein [Cyclobacteriaceae bacterium]|nr:helix-turn-helix domain-containing protein [Cyclobacteriaceae bacterium]
MKRITIPVKNKLEDEVNFKISRFREAIKKTSPHKHDDYFELIFLNEGEGFHSIESEKYLVSTPEFYILKPGQLHFWQFTSIPKGFVILFKDSFFDHVREAQHIELIRRLKNLVRIPVPSVYTPQYVFNEIFREYSNNTAYSKEIILGHLQALFAKILQLAEINSRGSDLPLSLYDKFLNLLIKECPRLHKVNEFAEILNITPQKLNHICQQYTKKSASHHIADRLLLEAKRHILHTDMNMNEIADVLHFNDASYFVKFFRKQEYITPLQFREKHQNYQNRLD